MAAHFLLALSLVWHWIDASGSKGLSAGRYDSTDHYAPSLSFYWYARSLLHYPEYQKAFDLMLHIVPVWLSSTFVLVVGCLCVREEEEEKEQEEEEEEEAGRSERENEAMRASPRRGSSSGVSLMQTAISTSTRGGRRRGGGGGEEEDEENRQEGEKEKEEEGNHGDESIATTKYRDVDAVAVEHPHPPRQGEGEKSGVDVLRNERAGEKGHGEETRERENVEDQRWMDRCFLTVLPQLSMILSLFFRPHLTLFHLVLLLLLMNGEAMEGGVFGAPSRGMTVITGKGKRRDEGYRLPGCSWAALNNIGWPAAPLSLAFLYLVVAMLVVVGLVCSCLHSWLAQGYYLSGLGMVLEAVFMGFIGTTISFWVWGRLYWKV